jgi:hypothetical protein
MGRAMRALILMLSLVMLAGCNNASPTYTLYRNSPLNSELRVHWATFDANDSGAGAGTYNQENCNYAAGLLNKNVLELNDGVATLKFWCELGKYKA